MGPADTAIINAELKTMVQEWLRVGDPELRRIARDGLQLSNWSRKMNPEVKKMRKLFKKARKKARWAFNFKLVDPIGSEQHHICFYPEGSNCEGYRSEKYAAMAKDLKESITVRLESPHFTKVEVDRLTPRIFEKIHIFMVKAGVLVETLSYVHLTTEKRHQQRFQEYKSLVDAMNASIAALHGHSPTDKSGDCKGIKELLGNVHEFILEVVTFFDENRFSDVAKGSHTGRLRSQLRKKA